MRYQYHKKLLLTCLKIIYNCYFVCVTTVLQIIIIFLLILVDVVVMGPIVSGVIGWVKTQWQLYMPVVALLELLLKSNNETEVDMNKINATKVKV